MKHQIITCDKCQNAIKVPDDTDANHEYTCPHCNVPIDIASILSTKNVPVIQIINNVGQQGHYIQNSSCATWSLILGILGIFTFFLTSIPAIICGHIAKSDIKASKGVLRGNGRATAGLILGYMPLWGTMLAGFLKGLTEGLSK